MKPSRKENLERLLGILAKDLPNPDRKANEGPLLHDVFLWSTIEDFAAKRCKEAWAAAQDADDGILPSDDVIRETYAEGEQVLHESKGYSFVVSLSKPRETFDLETFVSKVARKYKIRSSDLLEIAANAKKKGKSALSKRVLAV